MAVFEGELLSHPKGEKLWIQLTASKIVWQPFKSRSHPLEIDIQEESILDNTSVSTHSSINIQTPSPTNSPLIDQQKRLQNECSLKLRDVVGCEVARGPDKRDRTCYLRIYSYPYKHTLFSKQLIRTRKEIIFACNKHITFKNNQQEMDRWKTHIRKFLNTPQLKELLVLINPFGGAKKALEIFHLHAVSVLAEAGLQYVCLKTEYAGHARKLARELELGKWGGVVVVSGDGLVYEVLNGLMEHSNWREALKTPLGVIPAGSGNALASSLLFQAGECYKKNTVQTSCLMLSKLTVREMDVVVLQMSDSIDSPSSQTIPSLLNLNTNDNSKTDSNSHNAKQVFSLLSVAWGIIADIDIESEKFRVLGKARFTVGIVNRLINFRKYSGILSFLPDDSSFKSKFSTSPTSSQLPSSSQPLSSSSQPLSSSSQPSSPSSHSPSSQSPSSQSPSSQSPSSQSSPLPSPSQPLSSSSQPLSSSSQPPQSTSSLTQYAHSLTNEDIINNNIQPCHTTNNSDTSNNNKNNNNNTDIINNNSKNNHNIHINNDINNNIRDTNNNNATEEEDDNIITSFSGRPVNSSGTKESDTKLKTGIQNDILNTNAYLKTPLLKPLSEKVPEEWVSVQGDDFVSVLALYQSHLSQDDLIAPSSRFDDSCIHLFIIKGSPSRKRMVKYFTSIENGLNIQPDDPFTEMVKVKAFRLEPRDNRGIITVDGERVAYGSIQGQKLNRIARIFTF